MQLVVHTDGSLNCLYGEAIELSALGQLNIRRGSHVEPIETGQWIADLAPVSGPKLGPFQQRSQALNAEREWLEAHWLCQHASSS